MNIISSTSRYGFIEEVFIISGLIANQIIFSIYVLILNKFLAMGARSLSIVLYGGLASALFLLPFAFIYERNKWPTRLRPMLLVQMLLLALSGVLFQIFMMFGMRMTSPAILSAMPNLGPGLIFLIAVCCRLEKFSFWCKYSRVKAIGTIVCLVGAMAMSFLMSPTPSSPHPTSINFEWMLGFFYLLVASIIMSGSVVLQAATMLSFPAPFSLCLATTLLGSIMTAIVELIMEGNLDIGPPSLDFKNTITFVISGAGVSSLCMAFMTWCVKKKGPVMVSIFNPVQTVSSAILSVVLLGHVLSIGSVAGMLLMFVGLNVVLWAKKKEDCDTINAGGIKIDIHDIEKPLLS